MRSVKVGEYVTKIGVDEVDRLIDDCRFRRKLQPISTPSTTNTFPKVDRIKNGHKFRKLAPHPCTRKSSTNDKSIKMDRISTMPDNILQFIISSLTMREGASTSILSTRWRYLWITSFSCLNFDISTMLGYDYPNDMFKNEGGHILMNKISNFARWVDHVLRLRPVLRLDALRVSFALDKEFASHIDRWVESAAARGVTDIELDFDFDKFGVPRPLDLYEFPAEEVASSLKHLHLNFCILHLSPDFMGFTSLVTLSLSHIYVTQSIVDNILAKCPLLQFLSLACCQYETFTSLKIGGPSLLLKHLYLGVIKGKIYIELHDVVLSSFELGGHLGKLTIKNAPHLTRLVLSTALHVELSSVPRLEILFLTQELEQSIIPQSYVFNNLKRLVFIANCGTTDIIGVVYILEACHLLQELELDMGITELTYVNYYTETKKKLNSISGSSHYNLKEIEIYGFEGRYVRIELLKYLLKKAVVLEKMTIYTTSKQYDGNGNWSLYKGTTRQPISLKEARRRLQKVTPSSTKLELFSSFNP